MKIIIDGYNLIKRVEGVKRVSPSRKNEFLKMLSAYAKRRRHQIIVVFDGGDSNYPYQETIYNLTVIYSGYKEIADEVIGRYVQEHKGEHMFLVTSDNELANFAAGCGVDILKSDEFYVLLRALGAKKSFDLKITALHKTARSSSQEVDDLMQEATRYVEFKEEDDSQNRKSNPQKESKAIRQKQRKLKKL